MSNSKQIGVLIVDHNPIVLEGIVALIRAEPDMKVAGIATTAEAAFALYSRTRPDFTLIDLDLAQSSGPEFIRHIRNEDPEARIIVLAMYELDAAGLDALAAGATAILAKDQIAQSLVNLLRTSLSAD